MSDELSDAANAPKEESAPVVEAPAEKPEKNNFDLISDEDVVMKSKPSVFAFFSMHVLAVVVFLVHFAFNAIDMMDDPENGILVLLKDFIASDLGRAIGFPILMLFIAWINRWMNISTSGRWFTTAMIFIAALPFLLGLNSIIGGTMDDYPLAFIPENYPYEIMGVIWMVVLIGFTIYYTNSFTYAVTTDGLIFRRSFMLNKNQRRILYDNIVEVNMSQGPIGTIIGFGTVTPMTSSGIGVGEESVGMSLGASTANMTAPDASDSTQEKVAKGFFKMLFGLMSAQRTIRTIRADPANCFFNVRKPLDLKMEINERHKDRSQSNQLTEMKDLLAQSLAAKEE
ncbi:MAG: PH domain-containing protein [Euryarchaeota archaeon]|nr:PH domain-containing protein [Euryarchaeota archaeon]